MHWVMRMGYPWEPAGGSTRTACLPVCEHCATSRDFIGSGANMKKGGVADTPFSPP